MARCQVGRQYYIAYVKALSIVQTPHPRDPSYRGDDSILRIIFLNPGSGEHRRAPIARDYSRAAHTLQFRDPSGMVEVDVGVDNEFYVSNPETE